MSRIANMPSAMAREASYNLEEVVLPYALSLARGGLESAFEEYPELGDAWSISEGELLDLPVAVKHKLPLGAEGIARLRRRLVGELKAGGIQDEQVLDAIGTVPRERFIPEGVVGAEFLGEKMREWPLEQLAYEDRAVSIALEGQSISQPYVVAKMTEMLELSGGEKVLEVGTGTGYQAAVLAEMGAQVFTVERDADLVRAAKARLRDLAYDQVRVRQGNGYRGWPKEAPFDRVLVTAQVQQVPTRLVEELKVGGLLVMPVGSGLIQRLVTLRKTDAGLVLEQGEYVRFVPMVGQGAGRTTLWRAVEIALGGIMGLGDLFVMEERLNELRDQLAFVLTDDGDIVLQTPDGKTTTGLSPPAEFLFFAQYFAEAFADFPADQPDDVQAAFRIRRSLYFASRLYDIVRESGILPSRLSPAERDAIQALFILPFDLNQTALLLMDDRVRPEVRTAAEARIREIARQMTDDNLSPEEHMALRHLHHDLETLVERAALFDHGAAASKGDGSQEPDEPPKEPSPSMPSVSVEEPSPYVVMERGTKPRIGKVLRRIDDGQDRGLVIDFAEGYKDHPVQSSILQSMDAFNYLRPAIEDEILEFRQRERRRDSRRLESAMQQGQPLGQYRRRARPKDDAGTDESAPGYHRLVPDGALVRGIGTASEPSWDAGSRSEQHPRGWVEPEGLGPQRAGYGDGSDERSEHGNQPREPSPSGREPSPKDGPDRESRNHLLRNLGLGVSAGLIGLLVLRSSAPLLRFLRDRIRARRGEPSEEETSLESQYEEAERLLVTPGTKVPEILAALGDYIEDSAQMTTELLIDYIRTHHPEARNAAVARLARRQVEQGPLLPMQQLVKERLLQHLRSEVRPLDPLHLGWALLDFAVLSPDVRVPSDEAVEYEVIWRIVRRVSFTDLEEIAKAAQYARVTPGPQLVELVMTWLRAHNKIEPQEYQYFKSLADDASDGFTIPPMSGGSEEADEDPGDSTLKELPEGWRWETGQVEGPDGQPHTVRAKMSEGEGPVLVMLHGAEASDVYDAQVNDPEFLPGVKKVILDRYSSQLEGEGTSYLDEETQVVASAIEAFVGDEPMVLVPHSFGGLIAKEFYRGDEPWKRTLASRIRGILFSSPPSARMLRFHRDWVVRNSPRLNFRLYSLLFIQTGISTWSEGTSYKLEHRGVVNREFQTTIDYPMSREEEVRARLHELIATGRLHVGILEARRDRLVPHRSIEDFGQAIGIEPISLRADVLDPFGGHVPERSNPEAFKREVTEFYERVVDQQTPPDDDTPVDPHRATYHSLLPEDAPALYEQRAAEMGFWGSAQRAGKDDHLKGEWKVAPSISKPLSRREKDVIKAILRGAKTPALITRVTNLRGSWRLELIVNLRARYGVTSKAPRGYFQIAQRAHAAGDIDDLVASVQPDWEQLRTHLAGLTPKKAQLLRLLPQRMSVPDMAEQLGLTERTVETYIAQLLAQYQIERRKGESVQSRYGRLGAAAIAQGDLSVDVDLQRLTRMPQLRRSELRVLQLIAQGFLTLPELAKKLRIRPNSVRNMLWRIVHQLDLSMKHLDIERLLDEAYTQRLLPGLEQLPEMPLGRDEAQVLEALHQGGAALEDFIQESPHMNGRFEPIIQTSIMRKLGAESLEEAVGIYRTYRHFLTRLAAGEVKYNGRRRLPDPDRATYGPLLPEDLPEIYADRLTAMGEAAPHTEAHDRSRLGREAVPGVTERAGLSANDEVTEPAQEVRWEPNVQEVVVRLLGALARGETVQEISAEVGVESEIVIRFWNEIVAPVLGYSWRSRRFGLQRAVELGLIEETDVARAVQKARRRPQRETTERATRPRAKGRPNIDRQVIQGIAEGKTNQQIAEGIGSGTTSRNVQLAITLMNEELAIPGASRWQLLRALIEADRGPTRGEAVRRIVRALKLAWQDFTEAEQQVLEGLVDAEHDEQLSARAQTTPASLETNVLRAMRVTVGRYLLADDLKRGELTPAQVNAWLATKPQEKRKLFSLLLSDRSEAAIFHEMGPVRDYVRDVEEYTRKEKGTSRKIRGFQRKATAVYPTEAAVHQALAARRRGPRKLGNSVRDLLRPKSEGGDRTLLSAAKRFRILLPGMITTDIERAKRELVNELGADRDIPSMRVAVLLTKPKEIEGKGTSKGGRWPWMQDWYDDIGQDWIGQSLAPTAVESGTVALLTFFGSISAAILVDLPLSLSPPLLLVWLVPQLAWHLLHLPAAPGTTFLERFASAFSAEKLAISGLTAATLWLGALMEPEALVFVATLVPLIVLPHLFINLLLRSQLAQDAVREVRARLDESLPQPLELGRRVVEIGAGDGKVTERLAKAHPHTRFIVFESDPQQYAQLIRRLGRRSNVTVIGERAQDWAGRESLNGRIDTVLQFFPYLENAGEPETFAEAVARWLRPGGQAMIVSDHGPWSSFFMQDNHWQAMEAYARLLKAQGLGLTRRTRAWWTLRRLFPGFTQSAFSSFPIFTMLTARRASAPEDPLSLTALEQEALADYQAMLPGEAVAPLSPWEYAPEDFEAPAEASDLTLWSGVEEEQLPLDEFGDEQAYYMGRPERAKVRAALGLLIPEGARILDLMTGLHTHMPDAVRPEAVFGLGLSAETLTHNDHLDAAVLEDVNDAPHLPFADASFDAVTLVSAVLYARRPVELFQEVERVLKPGGVIVVAWSGETIPSKVGSIWWSNKTRSALLSALMAEAGGFGEVRQLENFISGEVSILYAEKAPAPGGRWPWLQWAYDGVERVTGRVLDPWTGRFLGQTLTPSLAEPTAVFGASVLLSWALGWPLAIWPALITAQFLWHLLHLPGLREGSVQQKVVATLRSPTNWAIHGLTFFVLSVLTGFHVTETLAPGTLILFLIMLHSLVLTWEGMVKDLAPWWKERVWLPFTYRLARHTRVQPLRTLVRTEEGRSTAVLTYLFNVQPYLDFAGRPIVVADIGMGFPPTTTTRLAEHLTVRHPDSTLIGVDLHIPHATVEDPEGNTGLFDARGRLTAIAYADRRSQAAWEEYRQRGAGLVKLYDALRAHETSGSREVVTERGRLDHDPLAPYRRPGLRFHEGDLSLPDGVTADLVTALNVLSYLPGPREAVLARLGALVAEGGLLVVGGTGLASETPEAEGKVGVSVYVFEKRGGLLAFREQVFRPIALMHRPAKDPFEQGNWLRFMGRNIETGEPQVLRFKPFDVGYGLPFGVTDSEVDQLLIGLPYQNEFHPYDPNNGGAFAQHILQQLATQLEQPGHRVEVTGDGLIRVINDVQPADVDEEDILNLRGPAEGGGRWPWLQWAYDAIESRTKTRSIGQAVAPSLLESGGFVTGGAFLVSMFVGLPFALSPPMVVAIATLQLGWHVLHGLRVRRQQGWPIPTLDRHRLLRSLSPEKVLISGLTGLLLALSGFGVLPNLPAVPDVLPLLIVPHLAVNLWSGLRRALDRWMFHTLSVAPTRRPAWSHPQTEEEFSKFLWTVRGVRRIITADGPRKNGRTITLVAFDTPTTDDARFHGLLVHEDGELVAVAVAGEQDAAEVERRALEYGPPAEEINDGPLVVFYEIPLESRAARTMVDWVDVTLGTEPEVVQPAETDQHGNFANLTLLSPYATPQQNKQLAASFEADPFTRFLLHTAERRFPGFSFASGVHYLYRQGAFRSTSGNAGALFQFGSHSIWKQWWDEPIRDYKLHEVVHYIFDQLKQRADRDPNAAAELKAIRDYLRSRRPVLAFGKHSHRDGSVDHPDDRLFTEALAYLVNGVVDFGSVSWFDAATLADVELLVRHRLVPPWMSPARVNSRYATMEPDTIVRDTAYYQDLVLSRWRAGATEDAVVVLQELVKPQEALGALAMWFEAQGAPELARRLWRGQMQQFHSVASKGGLTGVEWLGRRIPELIWTMVGLDRHGEIGWAHQAGQWLELLTQVARDETVHALGEADAERRGSANRSVLERYLGAETITGLLNEYEQDVAPRAPQLSSPMFFDRFEIGIMASEMLGNDDEAAHLRGRLRELKAIQQRYHAKYERMLDAKDPQTRRERQETAVREGFLNEGEWLLGALHDKRLPRVRETAMLRQLLGFVDAFGDATDRADLSAASEASDETMDESMESSDDADGGGPSLASMAGGSGEEDVENAKGRARRRPRARPKEGRTFTAAAEGLTVEMADRFVAGDDPHTDPAIVQRAKRLHLEDWLEVFRTARAKELARGIREARGAKRMLAVDRPARAIVEPRRATSREEAAVNKAVSADLFTETETGRKTRRLLTRQEERRLIRLAQAGNPAARQLLITANEGLIDYIVTRVIRRVGYMRERLFRREDLFTAGISGLLEAIDGFSLRRSSRLVAYAGTIIRSHISEELAHWLPTTQRLWSDVSELRHLAESLDRQPTEDELMGAFGWGRDRAKSTLVLDAMREVSLDRPLRTTERPREPEDVEAQRALEDVHVEQMAEEVAWLRSYLRRKRVPVRDQNVWLLQRLGPVTFDQVGHLYGITRARADQLARRVDPVVNSQEVWRHLHTSVLPALQNSVEPEDSETPSEPDQTEGYHTLDGDGSLVPGTWDGAPREASHPSFSERLQQESPGRRIAKRTFPTPSMSGSSEDAEARERWAQVWELLRDTDRIGPRRVGYMAKREAALNELFELMLERFTKAGKLNWGYHRFQHLLETAYLQVDIALAHRYRESEILAMLVASLLHDDFDPQNPNAPPKVDETLARLDNDAEQQAILHAIDPSFTFQQLVRDLIEVTDFNPPVGEPLTAPIRPRAWSRLVAGIEQSLMNGREQSRRFAMFERFSLADKAATYLLLNAKDAQERVRELAQEQGASEYTVLIGTPDFFDTQLWHEDVLARFEEILAVRPEYRANADRLRGSFRRLANRLRNDVGKYLPVLVGGPGDIPRGAEPPISPMRGAADDRPPFDLERYESLERFVEQHRLGTRGVRAGMVYDRTPFDVLVAVFEELQRRLPDGLQGKKLLDFGAGDLRASFVAASLYGMTVRAVEENLGLSVDALTILDAAEHEGYADGIEFLDLTDAFEVDWSDIDVVYFFYTEPADPNEARDLRERLQQKLLEAKPGAVLALVFHEAQVGGGIPRLFNELQPLDGHPVQVVPGQERAYLQLYQVPPRRPIAGASGTGPQADDQEIGSDTNFSEADDDEIPPWVVRSSPWRTIGRMQYRSSIFEGFASQAEANHSVLTEVHERLNGVKLGGYELSSRVLSGGAAVNVSPDTYDGAVKTHVTLSDEHAKELPDVTPHLPDDRRLGWVHIAVATDRHRDPILLVTEVQVQPWYWRLGDRGKRRLKRWHRQFHRVLQDVADELGVELLKVTHADLEALQADSVSKRAAYIDVLREFYGAPGPAYHEASRELFFWEGGRIVKSKFWVRTPEADAAVTTEEAPPRRPITGASDDQPEGDAIDLEALARRLLGEQFVEYRYVWHPRLGMGRQRVGARLEKGRVKVEFVRGGERSVRAGELLGSTSQRYEEEREKLAQEQTGSSDDQPDRPIAGASGTGPEENEAKIGSDTNLSTGSRVIVDLGARDGLVAKWLAEHDPDAQVFAVERDPLEYRKIKRALTGRQNAKAVEADLREWRPDVPVDEADLFFPEYPVSLAIEWKSFRSIFAMLKAGGILVLVTERIPSLRPDLESEFRLLRQTLEQIGFVVEAEELPVSDLLKRFPQLRSSSTYQELFKEPLAQLVSRLKLDAEEQASIRQLRSLGKLAFIRAIRPLNPTVTNVSLASDAAAAGRKKVILDIGSGTGALTRRLAQLHPEAEVIALEPEAFYYEATQGMVAGLENVRVEQQTIQDWQPTQPIDEAYVAFTWSWFDDASVEQIYGKIQSILKPGGSLVLAALDEPGHSREQRLNAHVATMQRLGFEVDQQVLSSEELVQQFPGLSSTPVYAHYVARTEDQMVFPDDETRDRWRQRRAHGKFVLVVATKPEAPDVSPSSPAIAGASGTGPEGDEAKIGSDTNLSPVDEASEKRTVPNEEDEPLEPMKGGDGRDEITPAEEVRILQYLRDTEGSFRWRQYIATGAFLSLVVFTALRVFARLFVGVEDSVFHTMLNRGPGFWEAFNMGSLDHLVYGLVMTPLPVLLHRARSFRTVVAWGGVVFLAGILLEMAQPQFTTADVVTNAIAVGIGLLAAYRLRTLEMTGAERNWLLSLIPEVEEDAHPGEIGSDTNLSEKRTVPNADPIEAFYRTHGIRERPVADGSGYGATPLPVLRKVYEELERRVPGGLAEKHLLEIGTGDLRAAVMAAHRHGMHVTATEKDPGIWREASDIFEEAKQAGLTDRITLLPAGDALDVSWQDIDIGYFYYTQPGGRETIRRERELGDAFRAKLQAKLRDAKPGAVLAMVFMQRQIDIGRHRFPELKTLVDEPILLTEADETAFYLQLYQVPANEAVAGGSADNDAAKRTVPNEEDDSEKRTVPGFEPPEGPMGPGLFHLWPVAPFLFTGGVSGLWVMPGLAEYLSHFVHSPPMGWLSLFDAALAQLAPLASYLAPLFTSIGTVLLILGAGLGGLAVALGFGTIPRPIPARGGSRPPSGPGGQGPTGRPRSGSSGQGGGRTRGVRTTRSFGGPPFIPFSSDRLRRLTAAVSEVTRRARFVVERAVFASRSEYQWLRRLLRSPPGNRP